MLFVFLLFTIISYSLYFMKRVPTSQLNTLKLVHKLNKMAEVTSHPSQSQVKSSSTHLPFFPWPHESHESHGDHIMSTLPTREKYSFIFIFPCRHKVRDRTMKTTPKLDQNHNSHSLATRVPYHIQMYLTAILPPIFALKRKMVVKSFSISRRLVVQLFFYLFLFIYFVCFQWLGTFLHLATKNEEAKIKVVSFLLSDRVVLVVWLLRKRV